jgi:iron complex outermembrane receptor protein
MGLPTWFVSNARALRAAGTVCCAVTQALAQAAAPEIVQTLPEVTARETPSVAERNQLPVTTESVTREQAADTVNVMNIEDALRYVPNVLVRKRYIGDTQAPMSSRTTGINASARTLIYADGVLLSTLINNNNANGSPQWFMVAPEEMARIDVMYGPFAAAYAGNSYGAVTEITTRMPTAFEADVKASGAQQNFSQYGTKDNYSAGQASAMVGDRRGDLSWRLSYNHLDSFSQPVTYLTINQSAVVAGGGLPVVGGAYADLNRTGGRIQVLGAGNLTHTIQDNAKLKVAYDFTPTVSAIYTLGYWQNNANANPQTYLASASGAPFFGAAAGNVNIGGFSYSASAIGALFNSSRVDQEHWMQGLTVKTSNGSGWDWEAVLSGFNYGKDTTRQSTGLFPAAQAGGAGRIGDASGTGWKTADLKGFWRPDGPAGTHVVSFGAHYDQYTLVNPTYNTANWVSGAPTTLFSDGSGKTQTAAVWGQEVWRFAPAWKATLGLRYEYWRAYDGFNYNVAGGIGFPVVQPGVSANGFSPKAAVAWEFAPEWTTSLAVGKALRFPTVGELYQNVTTGAVFTAPNPYLKPESVVSEELALERNTLNGRVRVSLFNEVVDDALISQTSMLPGFATPVAYTQNVTKTRQRGIEVVGQQKDVFVRGLELSGSVTYVDARILENNSYVPPLAIPSATSVGKQTPYVPTWRATAVATYRPDAQWTLTVAGRYSTRLWATVDNTDIYTHTYQGFDGYLVGDLRVRYQIDRQWSAALGVDNFNNRKYFLFHPFPQRTALAELKYSY